jgi:hypothetical protein
MKRFFKKTLTIVRQNYIPLCIFCFMLFRPQILFWLRTDVIRPVQKHFHHSPSRPYKCMKSGNSAVPVVNAGLVRSDDSDDDGCGDDGSCTDDSGSDTGTDEDYSSDDGCNDDGSCENEDDSYYQEDDSDNGDGCSCAGETVVTSSGTDNSYYYNSSLQIKLNINSPAVSCKLYITNSAGNTVVTYFRNTTFGRGLYYYSWEGDYDNGQFAGAGYYKAVFESEGSPYFRHEQNFYYSSEHGFEVNGTAGNILEFSL